ncbi:MerR family transcriptional regulator [Chromatium weissei]|nr:MerR family transcriptional regulator [Chromatium weissei]
MKIGEIAQRLNTTVRTLRFYEEQGLIHPRRKPSGTRIYSEDDLERFAALINLARLGFSLQSLAELAGIRKASATGDEASRAVAKRLTEIEAELAERARAIECQRADIAKALTLVRQCHDCQQRPVRSVCAQCPISAELKDIGILKLVWDEEMPCLCDNCNQPI